jgi:hypothetical protein
MVLRFLEIIVRSGSLVAYVTSFLIDLLHHSTYYIFQ